jgi:hypothetical protein
MKTKAFKIREFGTTTRLLQESYPTFAEAEKAFDAMGGLSRCPALQIVQEDGEAVEITHK